MKSIQQLRAERADKARQSRAILDDKAGWNAEAAAKVEAIYAEIDLLDGQIGAIEKQLKIEGDAAAPILDRAARAGISVDEATHQKQMESRIFRAKLLHGRDFVAQLPQDVQDYIAAQPRGVQNAISTTTNTEGGYTVPREFSGQMLEALKAYGGMRQVASIIRTDHGRSIDWPTTDATAEEGELIAENTTATMTGADPVFGTVALGARKWSSKGFAVPIELLMDTAIDLEGHLRDRLNMRIGRIQNKKYTIGTGTNEPTGIVTSSAVGKTGATGQTTAITYDDFVDLEHSVDPAYRQGAKWMFSDTMLKTAKKLKDSTGRPLWRPGVTGGDANDILGYGYAINQDMPVPAANAKSVLFGALDKFLIRDVMDVTIFRMADSKYIEKGQIGFLAWARGDGALIAALISGANPAIKHYAHSAT